MSHDQNFKNLIPDYPHQALAFLAESEARQLSRKVRITPIREEQLQERLGERFRELDIPLLVEWPNGERAALLFVIEEESDLKRFSILRLAHYCLGRSPGPSAPDAPQVRGDPGGRPPAYCVFRMKLDTDST